MSKKVSKWLTIVDFKSTPLKPLAFRRGWFSSLALILLSRFLFSSHPFSIAFYNIVTTIVLTNSEEPERR